MTKDIGYTGHNDPLRLARESLEAIKPGMRASEADLLIQTSTAAALIDIAESLRKGAGRDG